MNVPGSLGWAAVNEKSKIVGYWIIRQVIREEGNEAMASLYADNKHIAKLLSDWKIQLKIV